MAESARVAVIGAGSWGTALAHQLGENGHRVTLWAREPEVAAVIREQRENPAFLPGQPLSKGVEATSELAAAIAAGRDLLVWVVPSPFSRAVLTDAAPHLLDGVPIVSATKGIEVATLKLVSEVFSDVLGADSAGRLAVLSGPSFAKEVVAGHPTAVAVAARDEAVGQRVQQVFCGDTFRVYTNDDVIGTQVGGAIKNVVALAAGAVEGLGFGHNTQAVLITRGLAEITRLGVAMGARPETFMGLSGIGDLVLTCTGGLSRNRTVGVGLGQGRTVDEIISEMNMVAEGVKTTAAAHQLARSMGVDMPIVTQVHRVLFEGATAREALVELMGRPQKAETELMG